MAGPVKISFCVAEGVVRLVHNPEQLRDMLVHIQSPETVSDKSAMHWVISGTTIGPTGDGFVRVIDGSSLADMMEGWFANFAVNI